MQTLAIGNVCLDRYLVLKVLGSGANGTVYLADDQHLKRKVAIKVLHEWSAQSAENAAKRFEREAQALSKLLHTNIIQVYRYGEFEGAVPFIVMEFVDGESLKDLIARRKRLSISEVVVVAKQIAEALEYAHRSGIVHRDLKPENVMVINQKTTHSDEASVLVKILDFGLSKNMATEQAATLTKTGMIVGTVLYMSPEQGLGEEIDSRSDIYSLGCLMYEMITGAPPFVEEVAAAVLLRHMNEPIPSLSAISPESKLPKLLDDIISRSCQKSRDNRYSDCSELLDDLQKLSKLKSQAVFIPESELKNKRTQKKILKLGIASLLFLMVVAAAAAMALFTDKGKIIFAVQTENVLDPNSSIQCLVNQHMQFLKEGKIAQACELADSSTDVHSRFSYWPAVQKTRLLYRYAQDYQKQGLYKESFQQSLAFFSVVFAAVRRQQMDTSTQPPEEEVHLLNELAKQIYYQMHTKKEWQELSALLELNSGAFPKATPGYLMWPAALRAKSKSNSGRMSSESDIILLSRLYSQAAEIAASGETALMFDMANAGVRFSRDHELYYDEHCQYSTICAYHLGRHDLAKARLALAEVERIAKKLLLSNAETERLNRLREQCGIGEIVPLPQEAPDSISLIKMLFSNGKRYSDNVGESVESNSKDDDASKKNSDLKQ